MSWDFRPPFLNDSNPCGDLINRLKYFRIWFRFPQYIWSKSSKNSIPHAVCMILRSQNFRLSENNFFPFKFGALDLQCDAHHGAWLCSGMHTAELDSLVWCTPQSSTSQGLSHRGVRLFQQYQFFVFCYLLCLLTPFKKKLLK